MSFSMKFTNSFSISINASMIIIFP
jgi:hypothetical protein